MPTNPFDPAYNPAYNPDEDPSLYRPGQRSNSAPTAPQAPRYAQVPQYQYEQFPTHGQPVYREPVYRPGVPSRSVPTPQHSYSGYDPVSAPMQNMHLSNPPQSYPAGSYTNGPIYAEPRGVSPRESSEEREARKAQEREARKAQEREERRLRAEAKALAEQQRAARKAQRRQEKHDARKQAKQTVRPTEKETEIAAFDVDFAQVTLEKNVASIKSTGFDPDYGGRGGAGEAVGSQYFQTRSKKKVHMSKNIRGEDKKIDMYTKYVGRAGPTEVMSIAMPRSRTKDPGHDLRGDSDDDALPIKHPVTGEEMKSSYYTRERVDPGYVSRRRVSDPFDPENIIKPGEEKLGMRDREGKPEQYEAFASHLPEHSRNRKPKALREDLRNAYHGGTIYSTSSGQTSETDSRKNSGGSRRNSGRSSSDDGSDTQQRPEHVSQLSAEERARIDNSASMQPSHQYVRR